MFIATFNLTYRGVPLDKQTPHRASKVLRFRAGEIPHLLTANKGPRLSLGTSHFYDVYGKSIGIQ